MPRDEKSPFRPDLSDAGSINAEGDGATFTWFGPEDEPETRMRYAVIKEEDGLLQIQPGEGRFRKGLKAWRYATEDADAHTAWGVLKTRPNRIDLKPL
ncbi:MAG: hypothetical protein VX913_16015 [Planctomycetota bacterium]|nr:hypothetical protein [Planctomycetota bacterium]MEE2714277.1 hypothetical protein [Planctomycetota bacterium]